MQLFATLRRLAVASLFCVAGACASAPEAALQDPPGDARTWVVFSSAGQHGVERVWTDAEGRRWARLTFELRGFANDVDQALTLDEQGRPIRVDIRGTTPQGDAAESFEVSGGVARWRSPVDAGEASSANGFYLPFGGAADSLTVLARALIAAPDNTLAILPSGRAHIERLADEVVRNEAGEEKRVTAWAITGLAWYPIVLWLDDANEFFASFSFINYAPPGWEGIAPQLEEAQAEALAQRSVALAQRLGRRPNTPVAFQSVRMFDAESGRFLSDMNVIVSNGRITAVGPADEVVIPAGAEVISGEGRTLLPGLWDSHMHMIDDTEGPLLLANGVTSIRDPANIAADLERRIHRIERREMLGPRVLPLLLIDGPGPRAAQAAQLASNEAEALEHVRYAHEHGYIGVKIYGSLDPALVAPIAQEAHRLGLRVSGHIPAGMRPSEALTAGYDEFNHFYFTLMEAMPDEVVAESNGLMRIFGPAQYGADIDLDAPPMAPLISQMVDRGIVADPTINLVGRLLLPEPGQLPAAYASWEGALPPQVERGLRAGALAAPGGLTQDRIRQSSERMIAAIAELRNHGVTIVAGTDGLGLELVNELELYVQSGLSPAEALQTATIVPARVFGLEGQTGSIAAGKLAELVLIEGNPETDMNALRHVEWVMRDGMLLNAAELRASLGLGSPR